MTTSTKPRQIKVTQVRSAFGRKTGHAACVKGLGLRHTHHSVLINNTPENLGMIRKVAYLLKVENV